VESSPANDYLDVSRMRRAWADVRQYTTALSAYLAGTILLRGLMTGLFLNRT